jgi:glycosyltransferase involved in cell wall biosynthesis
VAGGRPSGSSRPLRVALACPGVGLSQRGFERMYADLFGLMRDEVNLTLFKGGGPAGEREHVLPFLPRNGRFLQTLPLHRLFGRSSIHAECMTFALALLPHLRGGAFDVVHGIDPPLVRMLYKLRRRLGLRFKLLYTHGCTMPPGDYPPADHLQHVAQGPHLETLQAGFAPGSMTLLPCGIYPERFEVAQDKATLRRAHGVPDGTFVILSVAALNRWHKRSHHLIDEAARLEGPVLLWLDGSMDQGEPDLIHYAHAKLGARCRITQVPTAQVGELYKLADVLVHGAVFEAFGLSIVEAAATGLPVLIHDAPHFRWLVPNAACWLDMQAPGALAARLAQLMHEPAARQAATAQHLVRQRFSWHALKPAYAAMWQHVAAVPVAGEGRGGINFYGQLHGA